MQITDGNTRIALAVDATSRNRPAMRSAMRIAERLDASVTALLVTSSILDRFAELPVATEVLQGTATIRRSSSKHLDLDLDRLKRYIAEDLREFARPGNVPWHLTTAMLESLEIPSADLLIVDRRAGHGAVTRSELGSVAAAILAHGTGSVLLLDGEVRLEAPVAVLLDRQDKHSIEIAARLAGASGRLLAFIDAPDQRTFEQLREYVLRSTRFGVAKVSVRWLQSTDRQFPVVLLRDFRGGLLVLDAATELLERTAVAKLLEQVRTPVLMTRTRPPD